jgi:hypothetical protein
VNCTGRNPPLWTLNYSKEFVKDINDCIMYFMVYGSYNFIYWNSTAMLIVSDSVLGLQHASSILLLSVIY